MNNYLKKYSNYFIGIGVVLLLMYFLDIVPFRFRNAPESLRLFMPIIFIIVGIIGHFLENENSNISHHSDNNDQPFDNEKYRVDKKDLTGVYSKDEIEKFIKAGRILSKTKIWKQDWYKWKSVKDTEFHYFLRQDSNKFNFYPYIIGVLIGVIITIIKFPHLVNFFTNNASENIELTNYDSGEIFEVANEDLEIKLTQEEAKSKCSELGNGWRLPTIDELKIMYDELHKNGRGDFNDESYWSDDGYEFDFASGLDNPYNSNILPQDRVNIPNWVRAVRTISLTRNSDNRIIIEEDEKRETFCPNCNGTGEEKYDCSTCKGDGIYQEYRISEHGYVDFECYNCGGYGYKETYCRVCGGGGKVYQ